jgi:hypothetical protein
VNVLRRRRSPHAIGERAEEAIHVSMAFLKAPGSNFRDILQFHSPFKELDQ